MEIVESTDSRQKMKLWVIEHFRVLPTDRRYKKLTEEQIEILFCSFVSSPTDDEYKQAFRRGMSKKEVIDTMPKELMEEMGYTEEDVQQISLQLAASGGFS